MYSRTFGFKLLVIQIMTKSIYFRIVCNSNIVSNVNTSAIIKITTKKPSISACEIKT